MAIQWNILSNALQSNPGEAFNTGMERGVTRAAMGALGQNPNDQRASNALMMFNPQAGMAMQDRAHQLDQRQRQQQAALIEQNRERIVMGGRLVRQLRPTDQAGWDRVLAAAQSMNIDLSDVPTQFDQSYAESLVQQADVLSPQSQEQFTLGEGQIRYGANGQVIATGAPARPRYYPIQPGGRLELDPSYAGPTMDGPAPQSGSPPPPQPGEVRRGYRFRGGNPASPESWEPAEGGAGASPATFQSNEFFDPNAQWVPTDSRR